MKSYTDIEQSKKLAEFLPIESADMVIWGKDLDSIAVTDAQKFMSGLKNRKMNYLPCWSLAVLLEIIRNNGRYELQMYEGGYYFESGEFMTESYFNPVDACYEMVIKLHEQKLL